MRCVWLTWSTLTLLSAILCSSGCLLPYWIKGSFVYELKEYLSDIGLYRRCTYPIRGVKNNLRIEQSCGHYQFSNIPHLYWKACLIMLSISTCTLIFLTFLLFTLGFCVELLKMTNVYKSCQLLQFISGVLVLISCILYPLGWRSNEEITQICGITTSMLSLGRCNVGWAFVITCAGGLIALLATTIPAMLMKNGCLNIPQYDTNQYYHGSLPSTTVASVGAVGPHQQHHQQHYLLPHGHSTAATRYSYVSYQSLLAPSNTAAAGGGGGTVASQYGRNSTSRQQQQQQIYIQTLNNRPQTIGSIAVPSTATSPVAVTTTTVATDYDDDIETGANTTTQVANISATGIITGNNISAGANVDISADEDGKNNDNRKQENCTSADDEDVGNIDNVDNSQNLTQHSLPASPAAAPSSTAALSESNKSTGSSMKDPNES